MKYLRNNVVEMLEAVNQNGHIAIGSPSIWFQLNI